MKFKQSYLAGYLVLSLIATGCSRIKSSISSESSSSVETATLMDGAWIAVGDDGVCNVSSATLSDGLSYQAYKSLTYIEGENNYNGQLWYESSDCTGTPALSYDGTTILSSFVELKAAQDPGNRKVISPAGAPAGFYLFYDFWFDGTTTSYGKAWLMTTNGSQSTFYYGLYLSCLMDSSCSVADDWSTIAKAYGDDSKVNDFVADPYIHVSSYMLKFTGSLKAAPSPSPEPSPQ